jgi:hypothetical protein
MAIRRTRSPCCASAASGPKPPAVAITATGRRASLEPLPTGSEIWANTIGIVLVSRCSSANEGLDAATIASGFRTDQFYGSGLYPVDITASPYELVINLKTAKVIGLDIPPEFPLRADEVIE